MQHLASSPEHSVWVAASAGTGKTKVLTDRVLRLLLQGVPPEKILCLTFTNAAAAEMASRIQKRLGEWVMLPEAMLIRQLEQLTGTMPLPSLVVRVRMLFSEVLEAPEGLNIQTIHAFCQSLIHRFPLEAGVSPASQVIDEAIARELLEEAKLRLLRGLYKQTDSIAEEAIAALSWRLAESSFTGLMEEIVSKSGVFASLFEQYPITELETKVYASLNAIPGISAEAVIEMACSGNLPEEALKLLAQAWLNGTDTEAKRGGKLSKWVALPIALRIQEYASYRAIFFTQEGLPAKKLLTKATLERCPNAEIILQQEQTRLFQLEEARKSQHCAILSLHVLHIAKSLLTIYQDIKSQRGFLDYNDLIHIGTALINDPDASAWILYKLDGGIDHILVDEAQDTSPAQWDIVTALSTEFFSGNSEGTTSRSLFVVGDEKQSIYSFQGADPKKFHSMHTQLAARAVQAKQSWHNIALDRSFRSTEAVLQAVDAIFAHPTLHQAISPSSPVQHTAHRQGHAGRVELWSPFVTEHTAPIEAWPLPTHYQTSATADSLLAEKIADTIAYWVQSRRILEAKNRPITPGDVLILVRKRSAFVDNMVRALKKRHIPVSGADRMRLTEHIAIMDIMALGKFLLLPQDDLTLATVLKTPLIGLSEEALFTLAYGREASLWETLKEKGLQPSSHNEEYHHAYLYLSSVLSHTDFTTPFALFSDILEVRGGREAFIRRLGHEANDALDEFLSLALNYSQHYTPSLQGFLHWLETSQVEVKRDMEQGADQVRIMTVHGSKGLQAPIVFLPDTMQVPTRKDMLLWAEGMMFWTDAKENRNSIYTSFHEANKTEEMNEYYRLLYVALTRAEDELYICGHGGKNKPPETCWYLVAQQGLNQAEGVQILEATEAGQPILRLVSEQTTMLPSHTDKIHNAEMLALPDYFLIPAPQETMPEMHNPSRIFTQDITSPIAQEQQLASLRGTLIHRLLEFLPSLPEDQRETKARKFLAPYREIFPAEAFDALFADVVRLITHPSYAWLFAGQSRAEVAVVGIVDGQAVAGQIDRLVVAENEVWVIDYKTTPNPPVSVTAIPQNYREQLKSYHALIVPLYPGKKVRCVLLWTTTLTCMEVD